MRGIRYADQPTICPTCGRPIRMSVGATFDPPRFAHHKGEKSRCPASWKTIDSATKDAATMRAIVAFRLANT